MKAHVVVLSLALASPAGAQTFGDDYSANHWLPACKDYMTIATGDRRSVQDIYARVGRATDADQCGGYVWGITDALADLRQTCVPPGVTRGQILRVLINELDRQPQRHHETSRLTIETLKRVWPCR